LSLRPIVACALLAFGCTAEREAPGRIDVWAFGREGEVLGAMAPAFERDHPGLSLRVQQIPWSAAHEKLLTGFVGETLPDVFQLGVTWIPELAMLGALEPLDARVAASKAVDPDDYFGGVWDASVVGGSLVALPWYVDTRLLFYRRDLLERAGVRAPPRTWAAWRDAMERGKRSLGDDRFALFAAPTEWEPPVALALSNGATLLRDGDQYGAFESAEFREAFGFYTSLFDAGLAPRAGSGASASVYRDFADGFFAYWLTGPWNLGELATRMPRELAGAWATTPLPGPSEDRPGVSIAGGASLAIRRGSPRADDAWKLLEWLAAPAQQVEFHRRSGDLPPRRSAWKDPLFDEPRIAAFRAQLEHVRALPRIPEWERIAARIGRAAEAAIRGEATPDEAIASLDRDVDRLLEKRRFLLAKAARSADPEER
jgi:multiple sugar transport system substrate-binding protein